MSGCAALFECSVLRFSDKSRPSSVRFHQSGSGGLGEPLDHGFSEEPSHQGDDNGDYTTPQSEDGHVGGAEISLTSPARRKFIRNRWIRIGG